MKNRHITLPTILLAACIIAWAAVSRAQFSMSDPRPAIAPTTDLVYGPYVNAVSPETASVHWISLPGVDVTCKLTGNPSAKMQLLAAPIPKRIEIRHTAQFTGLKPDQSYHYTITAGRDHAEGSFHTAPATGSKRPFTFVITGDTQSWPLRIRTVTEAISREAPEFMIHTGDCCDDGQKWPLWEREFFGPARDLLRQTTIWNARGNHEQGIEPFSTIFNLASPWYSFDYGNLHVAILDQWDLGSDLPMEPERMTAMAAWLDKDLAAAKSHADWIIVAGHQGMFNVSGHGSTWGHEQILPLLYKHGVDLFVCGHSHLYERFVPIGPPEAKPIQFIVAAGGGGYTYPSVPSPILVKTHAGPHYCLYHINGERLELTVKGTDGSIIDELAFTKTNGAVAPNVIASAITPEDAMRLLKPYKGIAVDLTTPPIAGKPLTCSLSPRRFPPGSKVTITTDPGSPWSVEAATFTNPEAAPTPELVVSKADLDKTPPWLLKVTPPAGVLLDQNQNFSPELSVNITLEYKGRTWSNSSVPLGVNEESFRRLVPVPEIVDVPPAPANITLDGDLAAWKDIPALHLPSTGAASHAIKLAWNKDGLWGAVTVDQGEIHTDPNLPGNADSLEIELEGDARARISTSPTGAPLRFYLSPAKPPADPPDAALPAAATNPPVSPSPTLPLSAEISATLHRVSGRLATGAVQSAWRKTATGYILEFRISAKGLTPLPENRGRRTPATAPVTPPTLEPGRAIGLDLILRHDGIILEQFANTRAFRATESSPIFWGEIRLAPK